MTPLRLMTPALVVVLLTMLAAGCASEDFPAGDTREGQIPTVVAGATAAATEMQEEQPVWVATVPRLTVPGQTVTVTGYGFGPSESVGAVLQDATGQVIAASAGDTTDLRGGFAAAVLPLPSGLAAAEYAVVVRGAKSGREGHAILWIQNASPALSLSQESAHPEDLVAVQANGFVPRERVVIYFAGRGGEPLTAVNADQQGNARADNVPIPLLAPGDQQIVATGAVSMAQATKSFRILPFEPSVVLNADTVPPGEAVGFYGFGFATRDQIEINLEGSEELPVRARTDDRGRLIAPQAFSLPANVKGQQAFALNAQRTGRRLRVPFQVAPSYPFVELSSYYGGAGSEIGLAVRGLRARERLEVFLLDGGQRKKLASFRADENGWLRADSRFAIPAQVQPSVVTLTLDGEASRPPMRVRFAVVAS